MQEAWERIRNSSMWFLMPTLLVGGVLAHAIVGYEPLVLDSSLYESREAYAEAVGLEAAKGSTREASSSKKGSADEDALTESDSAQQVEAEAQDAAARYADGSWTGYAASGQGNDAGWAPYYVAVTVKVEGGKPVGVTSIAGSSTGEAGDAPLAWNESESGRFLAWALDGRDGAPGLQAQMNAQLSASGSVGSVDTVSGATYSSQAIIRAYGAALAKAAQAAGSELPPEEPTPVVPAKEEQASDNQASGEQDKPETVEPGKDEQLDDGATLADGTWVGYAACGTGNTDDWNPYYVKLSVTVKKGKVRSISHPQGTARGEKRDPKLSWDKDAPNERYLTWAIEGRTKKDTSYQGVWKQLRQRVSALAKAKPADYKPDDLGQIDVVSGATYSSRAIVRAYYAALRKSAAAAGSTIDDTGEDEEQEQGGDSGRQDDDGAGDNGDEQLVDDTGGDSGDDSGDDTGGDAGGDTGRDTDDDTGEDDPPAPVLVDGDYVGTGWCEDPDYEDEWDPYYVLVGLHVEQGVASAITSIEGDTEGAVDGRYRFDVGNAVYLRRAIQGTGTRPGVQAQLQAKIDARQAVDRIDIVSGATFSSRAIFAGYLDALEQAAQTATDQAADLAVIPEAIPATS